METHMRYTARSPALRVEKAFNIDFPVDHVEEARRTNIEADIKRVTVNPVTDPHHWKLDTHGFCILQAKSNLDLREVFERREDMQKSYWYEVEAILHKSFPQYSRIEAFDLTSRKRDEDFPDLVTGYRDEYEPPSTTVHCDYSRAGGPKILKHCFPGQDDYWKDKKFDLINVWRLASSPTDDWPLALCDYTTVDVDKDVLCIDNIRRDVVDEASLLHFNEAHKWYYFKGIGVDDLIVFRNCDSDGERARAFHAAVANPQSTGPSRESIEVRLVAFY